jgi:endo-beta-N-acetylglucosaminidase D
LREGQDYSFEIVLGNRRTNTITVKFLNPETKIDSIKGLYTKTRYVLRRPAPGIHTVRAKVYEYWQHGDTLMTNWYG